MPSLKLKKWNATRWLGRFACLDALCHAYEYILDHLREEISNRSNKETQKAATELYSDLTSYDTFLFFFLYRDIAERMAIASKTLQQQDLQIPDVGRIILQLRANLTNQYPQQSYFPNHVSGTTDDNNILEELFGVSEDSLEDSNTRMESCSLIALEIKEMEDKLHPPAKETTPPSVEESVEPPVASLRPATRRINNSAKWAALIPKSKDNNNIAAGNVPETRNAEAPAETYTAGNSDEVI
jgi:hypothetical protein